MAKIGLLTGGGDCPGLNPVIRAVVRKADLIHYHVIGIRNGWKGLIEGDTEPLTLQSVSGILPKGGTVLGTSRTNPYKKPEDVQKALSNYRTLGLESLVAIGGEDTLSVALKLMKEGMNIIGVPKTIDNDLSQTDYTFGFDTAVNIAMEAIDRLHTTAESHQRVMVVETMGRHAGWIATHAGMAGGADIILIPEEPIDIDAICELLQKRFKGGKTFSIVVVAEGAKFPEGTVVTQEAKLDAFGHVRLGGIGHVLAEKIEARTGFETRVTVLGHILRGGSPSAFDRVLGTRFGIAAVELVQKKQYGMVVSLQGNKIVPVPMQDVVSVTKTVDRGLYEIAKVFFG